MLLILKHYQLGQQTITTVRYLKPSVSMYLDSQLQIVPYFRVDVVVLRIIFIGRNHLLHLLETTDITWIENSLGVTASAKL